jgi:hypothetical protein
MSSVKKMHPLAWQTEKKLTWDDLWTSKEGMSSNHAALKKPDGANVKPSCKSDGFLNCFFGQGFAQVQVLLDFPAFVPMFLGLFGAIISFWEGMFATSYGFGNNVQCFYHNWHTFLGTLCERILCQLRPAQTVRTRRWQLYFSPLTAANGCSSKKDG